MYGAWWQDANRVDCDSICDMSAQAFVDYYAFLEIPPNALEAEVR